MSPEKLVEQLAQARTGPRLCNMYSDAVPGAAGRRDALLRFLQQRWASPVVLVAEAPGYRGARLSGVPLTSLAQLHGVGRAEATATVVHRTLTKLGRGDLLLWNVVPFHPHTDVAASNRPPIAEDCSAGRRFLDAVVEGRQVISIGRVAQRHLPGSPYVRHPGRGGSRAFEQGLRELLV